MSINNVGHNERARDHSCMLKYTRHSKRTQQKPSKLKCIYHGCDFFDSPCCLVHELQYTSSILIVRIFNRNHVVLIVYYYAVGKLEPPGVLPLLNRVEYMRSRWNWPTHACTINVPVLITLQNIDIYFVRILMSITTGT